MRRGRNGSAILAADQTLFPSFTLTAVEAALMATGSKPKLAGPKLSRWVTVLAFHALRDNILEFNAIA